MAKLKPRLRHNAELHPHQYRGQRWYVVRDSLSGRNHRFSPVAHTLIAFMDGQRTLDEIWRMTTERYGDDAPTQDETIRLMAQLHGADLVKCDVSPDTDELLRRHAEQRRRHWKKHVGNPLALRFPLIDPDRFLDRLAPLVRPAFSPIGAAIWLAAVASAVLLAISHRDVLAGPAFDGAFAPANLVLLWISYTVIKTLHEFGHAFAVKTWGGEVHEMGVSFLVLMPLPYVDASAAATFRDHRQRIVVGGAGIMVELFLAALATFVWVSVEPGLVKLLAFDVMLIGSVSTLFFNGNPLLRFDGYYILADATGIPNLASRANRYIGYLCKRYVFGLHTASSPANASGESVWFVVYGAAAFAYRMFITFAIALFVSGKFLFVGIALALWALYALLVAPLARALKFLLFDPELETCRLRAVLASGSVVAALLFCTVFAPFPLATRAQGVVWLPEQSQVRAGTGCQLQEMLVPVNATVARGDPLLRCIDPFLAARTKLIEAKQRELESQRNALWSTDRVAADVLGDEIRTVAANLKDARARAAELVIRSPAAGKWVAPGSRDLPGRFVQQGDVLGFVINFEQVSARVVVPQSEVALVRERTEAVELRLAQAPAVTVQSAIERALPSGSKRLPSRALGSTGGGPFETSGNDADGLETAETFFEFDLVLHDEAFVGFTGGRVYARFDHGTEPLALRWYRSLRRLFLRQFNV